MVVKLGWFSCSLMRVLEGWGIRGVGGRREGGGNRQGGAIRRSKAKEVAILGKYHTSDCEHDQQPVSHDSSLSRLQPVAWMLEGLHCYSQSRGGGICWLTGAGSSEDKRQRKINSTGCREWRGGTNEHLKVKQAVSFDIALLLMLILPVHHCCSCLGVGERPVGQLRFWLRGADPLPPQILSQR